jgi:hypothetical protein
MQHKSVDQATNPAGGATKLPDASDFMRRDILIQAYSSWKDRVQRVTDIVNGNWTVVWPDLTREATAPTVANTIEMSISHWGAIGGSIIPSVKVPVSHTETGPEGSRGAAKRERRIRETERRSNISRLLGLWFEDYSGAGANAAMVWADFSLPSDERHPVIMRIDPRHYYPIVDAGGRVLECLIARKVHAYETVRRYPQLAEHINVDNADLEEWFWFEPDRIRHLIVDIRAWEKKKDATGLVLVDQVNELGRVPIVENVLGSFDGERRGMHDQTIHLMRVQHHLMNLVVEKTEEDVYSPVLYYDVEGAETFGPGAVMRMRSPDASLTKITSPGRFDVKDLISRLEEQARFQSVYPRQLTGDPGASIASGRAIGASQGALDARLAKAHKQFEFFLSEVSGMVLRFDETYCDGTKTIHGDSRDRKNPETFVPSRDIAGAYEVDRSYGLGAGSDPTNRETRLQMHLAAGLIARQTAREELDFLDGDTLGEEKRIAKEAMIDAVNQGILAAAAQQGPGAALRYFKLLNNESLTMEEVLIKFHEEEQAAAQEAAAGAVGGAGGGPGGVPGLDVAAGAESLARGGVPGQAEGLAPGAGLPALDGILAPGSPQQVL